MVSPQIKVYWWRPKSKPYNFGDELGAIILKKLGYKVIRTSMERAELITTGTIIDIAETKNNSVCIWGSGAGWLHDMPNNFDILAVRGLLTARCLDIGAVIGDPGILVSRLFPKLPAKYDIGVVRHFIDDNEYPFADIVIDATEDPITVINKISQCRTIMSSSLHGMIVANSYGIPAMRIARDDVISGDFKWLDYESSLTKNINEIQDNLLEVLCKRFPL